MESNEIKAVVEAILFVSDGPQTLNRIAEVMGGVPGSKIKAAIAELSEEYTKSDRGVQLDEVAGGYQISTKAGLTTYLDRFFQVRKKMRMSGAALETLSILAYRQPITRAEVSAIRGVNCDGVFQSLLERRLIKISGRKEVVGHPFLYKTTSAFLEHFGLRDLADLPKLEELVQAYEGSGAAEMDESPQPTQEPPKPPAEPES